MKGRNSGELTALIITIVGVAEITNAEEIRQILDECQGKRTRDSVRYNSLRRLVDSGYLKTAKAIIHRVDNRRRTTYQLTAKGLKQYNEDQSARKNLREIALKQFNKQID